MESQNVTQRTDLGDYVGKYRIMVNFFKKINNKYIFSL